ncbi:hypothetical protein LZ30DRAFT_741997, partial [Colletotrichum cereale]
MARRESIEPEALRSAAIHCLKQWCEMDLCIPVERNSVVLRDHGLSPHFCLADESMALGLTRIGMSVQLWNCIQLSVAVLGHTVLSFTGMNGFGPALLPLQLEAAMGRICMGAVPHGGSVYDEMIGAVSALNVGVVSSGGGWDQTGALQDWLGVTLEEGPV